MTHYYRTRATLEVSRTNGSQASEIAPDATAASGSVTYRKTQDITLATATNTAVAPSDWTGASVLLIKNTSAADITIKGAAGDTGVVIAAGGSMLLSGGSFTSASLLLYQSSGSSVVVEAYLLGD